MPHFGLYVSLPFLVYSGNRISFLFPVVSILFVSISARLTSFPSVGDIWSGLDGAKLSNSISVRFSSLWCASRALHYARSQLFLMPFRSVRRTSQRRQRFHGPFYPHFYLPQVHAPFSHFSVADGVRGVLIWHPFFSKGGCYFGVAGRYPTQHYSASWRLEIGCSLALSNPPCAVQSVCPGFYF